MHGKLSQNSKFLKDSKFSKYLVWSDYFKNQILISNKKYKTDEVTVLGHPYLTKTLIKNKIKVQNCLILDEDYIQLDDIEPYLRKIINIKKNSSLIYLGRIYYL